MTSSASFKRYFHLAPVGRASASRAIALAACSLALALSGCASDNKLPENAPSDLEADNAQAPADPGAAEAQAPMDGDAGKAVDAAKAPAPKQDAALDGANAKKAAPADAASPRQSLYARSGGKPTIDAVAADFVDLLAQHPTVKADAKLTEALARDPARHKQMLAEYLCRVSGGPCSYSGKPLREAHASLKVTAEQWRVMGAIFIKALRKNNVPKPERTELATLVAANKPLIVP
jgi:hemoglobin